MVNIPKIKAMCKEKGIKQGFVCAQFGVGSSYLNDVAKGKNSMSDERIAKVAEILGTSYAYLTDETDDPAPVIGEPIPQSELEKMQDMAIDMLRKLDDMQHLKMVLAMLEASRSPEE